MIPFFLTAATVLFLISLVGCIIMDELDGKRSELLKRRERSGSHE